MARKLLLVSIAFALFWCAALGRWGSVLPSMEAAAAEGGETPKLTVYSGGQVRKVLTEIVRDFSKHTGAVVAYQSGSSAKMLTTAIDTKDVDLYIAADLRHIRTAEQKDLVMAKVPVACLKLAMVVKKGNPKQLRGLKDLGRPGIRTYLEAPQGCQVGTATRDLLARNAITIAPAGVTMEGKPPSLGTVAQFINADLLDAAILWDAMAAQLADQVDVIAIPPEQNVSVNVVAVTFRFSANPALAEEFALFLRRRQSQAVWERHGFGTRLAGVSSPTADADQLKGAAERMIRTSQELLAPVYAPLAEHLVEDLDLAENDGVGIDLGSGPGTLIVELCKRTRLHWINADINPHFFGYFYRLAENHGVGHRVSAVLADAQNMPFRDNFADVVVSRGSYHFWPDRKAGFAEIYRILKPGGVATIGRGFSRNLPVAIARQIRSRQGKRMRYDPQDQARELRKIMDELGIKDYRVDIPRPQGADDVNYGVWIRFRKPDAAGK